jgi:plastocyanin
MMARIDFGGAMLALLGGFLVSAGLTGFVIAAGGYQFSNQTVQPMVGMGPGMAAAGAPALAAPKAAAVPAASQGTVDLKVVSTDLKFTPSTLQAKVGQTVKLLMDNKGVIEHDIALPTIKADKPAASLKALAKPGQSATLEFTPTAPGTYEYICTIPGHKEAGMKGTLNVTQ